MKRSASIPLIFLATIGYGLMPIFTLVAYAAKTSPSELVLMRFVGATVLMWVYYMVILVGILLTMDFSDARLTVVGVLLSVASPVVYSWYFLSLRHKKVIPVPSPVITTYVMTTGFVLMVHAFSLLPQQRLFIRKPSLVGHRRTRLDLLGPALSLFSIMERNMSTVVLPLRSAVSNRSSPFSSRFCFLADTIHQDKWSVLS